MSIAITGATGKLGSLVVQNLVKLTSPASIIATTRDPSSEASKSLQNLGVQVKEADFAKSETMDNALKGVRNVLITSVNVLGPEALAQHKAAIDACVRGGVDRIFYTSHIGQSAVSDFGPMVDHHETERYLEQSGVRFTSFRNAFYMWSLPMFLGDFQATNEISTPEDGPVSWVTHPDMAEAMAKVIASSDPPQIVNLVNSVAWDLQDAADSLSKTLQRRIDRKVISESDYVQRKVASGVPEQVAEMICGGYRSLHGGCFSETGNELQKLLGRKPVTLEEYLAQEFGSGTTQA